MDILQKAKDEALEYLFDGYVKNGGTPIFDISFIATANEVDPHILGTYLIKNNLVKNPRFDGNSFSAGISLAGIAQIKPEWINSKADKAIFYLGFNGNEKSSLLEILEMTSKDIQIAREIAGLLENEGFIHRQNASDAVYVWLTQKGLDFYNGNLPRFGN